MEQASPFAASFLFVLAVISAGMRSLVSRMRVT
jgi:hypothetical protein